MKKEVWLSKKGLEKARRIAAARNAENGGNDASGYRHDGFDRLPLTPEQSSLFGVVGEIGGHLCFGVNPDNTVWVVKKDEYKAAGLKTNADLIVNGRKVEIRNATAAWQPIPVKRKDRDANAIVVQVYVSPDKKVDGKPVRGESEPTGNVKILGWRYGSDFKEAKAKGDTHYMAAKYDVDSLAEVLGVDADAA